MIAVAESKEEVLDKIKADIYYKSGVWDVENVSGYSSRIKLRSCQIRYRADSALDQHLPVQKRYTISFVAIQSRTWSSNDFYTQCSDTASASLSYILSYMATRSYI